MPYNIDEIQNEALALVKENQFPTIANQGDFSKAGDLLKIIKNRIKAIEEKRLEYTAPLTKQAKAIKADFDKGAEPYVRFAEELESKMKSFWDIEKQRVDAEQAKLDAAAAKTAGVDGALVEIVNDIKTAHGDIATTTVRKVTKWRLMDATLLPSKFIAVNEKLMNEHVKAGLPEPSGIQYYEDLQLSSR